MTRLILVRHGQSLWNLANRFTGWVDVPLSPQGIQEALACGERLRNQPLDLVFVSTLIRAQMTAMLALAGHSSGKVPLLQGALDAEHSDWGQIYDDKATENVLPVRIAWQLNERYYGELQGLDKNETKRRYGEDQVHIWRRSYDVPPPKGESLELTAARTLPYFRESIVPELAAGKNILISAHGNSLRSIVMELDGLSKDEVLALEIATGVPRGYEFEKGKFRRFEI